MPESKTIRIGTRDSKLAMWQAQTVQQKLRDLGYETEIVAVKSDGDLKLDKPLYELGITGIFTKTLDIALLQNTVDIAVHSMKDVPTALPQGISTFAVLKRAQVHDIFVGNPNAKSNTIATGSLRRRAQWLHKFPDDSTTDLRGNVVSRLQKLENSDWKGAIFALAGLDRINVLPEKYEILDWMLPAPAQGAMVVCGRSDDDFSREALQHLNDENTALATKIERDFLRTLEGGCTAPIGAYAEIQENTVVFYGNLVSLNGKEKVEIRKTISRDESNHAGSLFAEELLQLGAKELMQRIKQQLSKS